MKERKLRLKLLLCVIGAALALEFAGCQGGSGEATTTGAGAAGNDTNSAATNAPATTNATQ